MGNTRNRIVRALLAAGVGTALALAPASPAAADDTPVVIAAFAYASPATIIQAGGTLTATNLDGAVGVAHNVVSQDYNPATGQPWFRSPLVATTTPQSVAGVADTPPGAYLYTCDLHGFMLGVLVIV